MSVIITGLVGWVGLMVTIFLNSILRVTTYGTKMPEIRAHQVSSLTAAVMIAFTIWLYDKYRPLESIDQALLTGFAWLGMTVAFDFILGRYVLGQPLKKIIFDYRIGRGRLWVFVLVWITLAPWVVYNL